MTGTFLRFSTFPQQAFVLNGRVNCHLLRQEDGRGPQHYRDHRPDSSHNCHTFPYHFFAKSFNLQLGEYTIFSICSYHRVTQIAHFNQIFQPAASKVDRAYFKVGRTETAGWSWSPRPCQRWDCPLWA